MKEEIKNEKEQWLKYYNNCDSNFIDNVLIDILAFVPKKNRNQIIETCRAQLNDNVQSITKTIFINSISNKILENYYGKFNKNIINELLIDIFSYLPKNKLDDEINKCIDFTNSNVKKTITKEIFITSLKLDLDSYKKILDESLIAIRTLQWVEDLIENKKEDE